MLRHVTQIVEFRAGRGHREVRAGDVVQAIASGVKGRVRAAGRNVFEVQVDVLQPVDADAARFAVGDRVAGPTADMHVTAIRPAWPQ